MWFKSLGKIYLRRTILGIGSMCFVYVSSFAQSEETINTLLNSADQKKIEKANVQKNQADAMIEEANQMYLETFNVQADYQLGEKEIKKRVEALESKARQKQFEASELYQKSHETKFSVNKIYIEKFWSGFTGNENDFLNARLIEEQSNDYYFQATQVRNEASKIKDNKEIIKKLNDAYDLEQRALVKQRAALASYYSLDTGGTPALTQQTEQPVYTPPVETVQTSVITPAPVYTPESTPIYQPVTESGTSSATVNQDMIRMYQNYLKDTTRYPEGFLTPEILAGINSFNADQILNIWYSYIYNQPLNEEYLKEYLAENPEQEPTETVSESPVNKGTGETASESGDGEEIIAEIHEGEDEKALLIPADENIIYRIQIAANKYQLDQRTLSKMYYGSKNVEMIVENGLYKYSIGDFEKYEDANGFRKQSGIKNAFIVAYRKGTRFIGPSEEKPVQQQAGDFETAETSDGLIFRVQVAANHFVIRKEQLGKICGTSYAIEQVEEDGWYKYQVPGVRLFSDALKIISNVRVDGAFIIAYDNGLKTDLYDAVKRSIKIEKEIQVYGRKGRVNDIEFNVQVAASKIPLNENEIAQIYPGNQKISLFIEDDWYKYRIKAGFDYNKAKEIKDNCGVEKSFIVAYNRAEKTEISKVSETIK